MCMDTCARVPVYQYIDTCTRHRGEGAMGKRAGGLCYGVVRAPLLGAFYFVMVDVGGGTF